MRALACLLIPGLVACVGTSSYLVSPPAWARLSSLSPLERDATAVAATPADGAHAQAPVHVRGDAFVDASATAEGDRLRVATRYPRATSTAAWVIGGASLGIGVLGLAWLGYTPGSGGCPDCGSTAPTVAIAAGATGLVLAAVVAVVGLWTHPDRVTPRPPRIRLLDEAGRLQ